MSVTQQYTKCSVALCDRSAIHVGMCGKHYAYNWRHGHPEIIDTIAEPLPLTEIEAAWLAAVFDCEGWIGTNKSPRGTRNSYNPKLGVGNTNKKLTDRLLQLTGCGYVRDVQPKSKNSKPQFHWTVHRRDEVRSILLPILPHLILKREQAELVLSLPTKHTKARNERELIHFRLRDLNRKGVAQ